jgi:hypothetical protein
LKERIGEKKNQFQAHALTKPMSHYAEYKQEGSIMDLLMVKDEDEEIVAPPSSENESVASDQESSPSSENDEIIPSQTSKYACEVSLNVTENNAVVVVVESECDETELSDSSTEPNHSIVINEKKRPRDDQVELEVSSKRAKLSEEETPSSISTTYQLSKTVEKILIDFDNLPQGETHHRIVITVDGNLQELRVQPPTKKHEDWWSWLWSWTKSTTPNHTTLAEEKLSNLTEISVVTGNVGGDVFLNKGNLFCESVGGDVQVESGCIKVEGNIGQGVINNHGNVNVDGHIEGNVSIRDGDVTCRGNIHGGVSIVK